ncbi:rRNA maturation RNase YbeY [Candidatus Collierbacteria bacterium]|nr:rRNA maturation RNase YbeY [Candidatus Collierbacteria bacterium]
MNDKNILSLKLEVKADSRYRFNRKKIRAGVLKVLEEQGIKQAVEVSLMVVGERKIRDLEKRYFGEDKVTDVLSFPQMDGESIPEVDSEVLTLGDVVVCYPQAKKQSLKLNRLLDDEIEFLACHGVLHLLGIHHD